MMTIHQLACAFQFLPRKIRPILEEVGNDMEAQHPDEFILRLIDLACRVQGILPPGRNAAGVPRQCIRNLPPKQAD
jgi:hypothetical protein